MAAVVDEAGIRGGEVINDGTARVAQQNVSAAVTVEIANTGDRPTIVDHHPRLIAIVDDTTVRGPKQIKNGAIVVAQQNVIDPVAIEIASANDMPAIVDGYRQVAAVVDESSVGIGEIIDDSAIGVAQQNVCSPVAIEVARASHLPAAVDA